MTPLNFETLLILGFASIATAQLMVKLNAPFDLMARIRAKTTIGGLLKCIYCSAWWAAICGYIMLQTFLAPLVYIAAATGIAVILWKYVGGDHV